MLHDCLAPDMQSSWLLHMWSSWLLYMWISWPLHMWIVWLVDIWGLWCFMCSVRDSLHVEFVMAVCVCVCAVDVATGLWAPLSWWCFACWVRDSLHMELEMLHMSVWLLDMWSSWLLYPIDELALLVCMDASHHTHTCVMKHVWLRRVIRVNLSTSHVWMRHRLHMGWLRLVGLLKS